MRRKQGMSRRGQCIDVVDVPYASVDPTSLYVAWGSAQLTCEKESS